MFKLLVNLFYRNHVLTEEELREAAERLDKAWHTPRNSVKVITPLSINLESTVVLNYYKSNGNTEYINEEPFFEKIPPAKKLRRALLYYHAPNHVHSQKIRRKWNNRYNYDPDLERALREASYQQQNL